MPHRTILAGLAVLALGLSSCGGAPQDPLRSAILVVPQRVELRLAVLPDGTVAGPALADYGPFLRRWRNQARGPLLVEADGVQPAALGRFWLQLKDQVRRGGGGPGEVTRRSGNPGRGVVLLHFQDFVVLPPHCDLAGTRPGRVWPGDGAGRFGCATRANLGAMVASPADLVQPRLAPGGDGARGADRVGAYRRGERTGAAPSGGAAGLTQGAGR